MKRCGQGSKTKLTQVQGDVVSSLEVIVADVASWDVGAMNRMGLSNAIDDLLLDLHMLACWSWPIHDQQWDDFMVKAQCMQCLYGDLAEKMAKDGVGASSSDQMDL